MTTISGKEGIETIGQAACDTQNLTHRAVTRKHAVVNVSLVAGRESFVHINKFDQRPTTRDQRVARQHHAKGHAGCACLTPQNKEPYGFPYGSLSNTTGLNARSCAALPRIVREGLVGLRHLVRVVAFFDHVALVVVCFNQFGRDRFRHRHAATRTGVRRHPTQGQ